MKKRIIFLFVIFLHQNGFSQIATKEDLISASRLYYKELKVFSVLVNVKKKTTIAEDTVKARYECYIDNSNKQKLFFLSANNGMFIDDSDEYFIFPETGKYRKARNKDKKFNIYHTRYIKYPFISSSFFDELNRESFLFTSNDSSYWLRSFTNSYEFRKRDYSIKTIINSFYNKTDKGRFFEETVFGDCIAADSLINVQMTEALSLIKDDDNQLQEADTNREIPRNFDLSFLETKGIRIVNQGKGSNLSNKTIFLDFFYEGCLPCVKSFPVINDLFMCGDSNVAIIGIDPQLDDTVNIQRFIDRYNIGYPVIVGKTALEINQRLQVREFPTFIVINPKGEITEYQIGHSESFFRKIRRTLLKKDCN